MDGPLTGSFGEFAVIAGWGCFLWSTSCWLWSLGSYCCTRRAAPPRQPERTSEAEWEQESPPSAKAKGRKDELHRAGAYRTNGKEETNQSHSGKETATENHDGITRGQSNSGAHIGSYGPKGSTSGARSTRNAAPWWFGSGPNAATWLPPPMNRKRTMGVLGYSVRDPLMCMAD